MLLQLKVTELPLITPSGGLTDNKTFSGPSVGETFRSLYRASYLAALLVPVRVSLKRAPLIFPIGFYNNIYTIILNLEPIHPGFQ